MDNPQPGLSTCQNVNSDEESEDLKLESNRKKRRIIYDSDSEINRKNNVETDNEADETTAGEINSKNVTSVVSQSIDLNELEFKGGGSDEKWKCDGNFRKKFVFEGSAGFKCSPDGLDPYNFFTLLFDRNFFSNIVTETNKFGNSKRGDQWKKLTVEEFKIFLGLLLHMGTIKCPQLQNYWNTKRLFNFNCFSQHMSRNRFQEILRCLHFSSNNTNNNRLNKIQLIIDYFNDKMKQVYYPHKELSIDDTIVPWRDRLAFRQYIAGKRHKCGIKLYVLTESSGVALRMYKESDDDISEKEHERKVVLHLLKDFLQRGHSVYMNDFYSSYELTKQLLDAKTYCTGTLRRLRKGNNVTVIKAKLAKGEIISRHKNNVMMGKFQDKREVLFISSEFKADLIELEDKRKGKHKKPLALHRYNEFINGNYKKDQMLSYYTCLRKTFKWYIKLWIHIVETLLLNSFFLHLKYSPSTKKSNFSDFRLNIIDALLFENNEKNIPSTLSQLEHLHEHLPEILPRDDNNRVKRKRCRQCFAKGVRKSTNYFCSGCKDNPGLCLGECFKEYHKNL